jgi:hypothetical protein
LQAFRDFLVANWGSIASVVGLAVSCVTLWVARKARESADAAKEEARRRNLSEDLQDAHVKSEQVGLFIRDGNWDRVFLRSQEISSLCSIVLKRWNKELNGNSKTQINLARDHAGSIAKVAVRAHRVQPSEKEIVNVSAAQRRLNELLSSELGEALRVIEGKEHSDV